jgi:3-polyprenyl-4-hydroxybenzoate decarboxylase
MSQLRKRLISDDGLRSWLQQADELGEIRTIEGADWDLEIRGVADIVTEKGSSPTVLFDSIKGYPKGYRVLVNSLGSTPRLGLTPGFKRPLHNVGKEGNRCRVN